MAAETESEDDIIRIRLDLTRADSRRLDQSAERARRSKAKQVQQIVLDHLDREDAQRKEPKL